MALLVFRSSLCSLEHCNHNSASLNTDLHYQEASILTVVGLDLESEEQEQTSVSELVTCVDLQIPILRMEAILCKNINNRKVQTSGI